MEISYSQVQKFGRRSQYQSHEEEELQRLFSRPHKEGYGGHGVTFTGPESYKGLQE